MNLDFALFHTFLNQYQLIPATDFELIRQHMQWRQVKAGDHLLEPGKTARELFFVANGILKITSTSEKGNEVIQFFVKENKFCTVLYSFMGQVVSQEGIRAATDGAVFVFTRPQLHRLYQQLPYVKELFEAIIQQALLDKIQLRNSLMGEEATTRYLKFMVQHPDILQRIALSDVASYLGITQQSLSRIRRNLTVSGKAND